MKTDTLIHEAYTPGYKEKDYPGISGPQSSKLEQIVLRNGNKLRVTVNRDHAYSFQCRAQAYVWKDGWELVATQDHEAISENTAHATARQLLEIADQLLNA